MTIEPRADGREKEPAIGRIEVGPDGIRTFKRSGVELVAPAGQPLKLLFASKGPSATSAPASPGSTPARHGGKALGKEWVDAVIAGQDAGARARLRNARVFRGEPAREGALFHYTRQDKDGTLDVTVDSLTGVPMEVTKRGPGGSGFHAQHTYERLANGVLLLRQTRVESTPPGARSPSVLTTRYDSVTFTRGGTVK